jgi:hypothetical protein
MLEAGADQQTAQERAAQRVGDLNLDSLLDQALLAAYRRQQELARVEQLVEDIETALEETGGAGAARAGPGDVLFGPVGYTRLTEERGDAAAATLAEALAVLVQGGDYFGRTVNLAPRIAVHASASRVLVSERVAERAPPLGVTFVEVGLVQLEGIAQPVRLLEARRA